MWISRSLRATRRCWAGVWAGICATLILAACAQPAPPAETLSGAALVGVVEQSAAPNPLRNVYFGDLHIHTRNSYDSYIFNVRATPDDAYIYAKGGSIRHAAGFEMRLQSGPLDFLAVTDHAEYLGVLEAIDTPGSVYSQVPFAGELFSSDRLAIFNAFSHFVESLLSGERMAELSDMSATQSAWGETIESAARHNAPGRFTTFIGYEFTSLPGLRNLHRNVIFASDAVPAMPFSALESQNPEDLWRWLEQRRGEGMEALAIPHNSNASDGTMFARTMWNGQPIDRAYAELRGRNEPLMEIIQTKGQSETMPLLSPNDEFAGFEVMDLYVGVNAPVTVFAGGYARDAFKRGLEIEAEIGANPYRMGIVAGSDGHNGASPYEENNYFANHGLLDGAPAQRGSVLPAGASSWAEFYAGDRPGPRMMGSGGLTGVWAEENTRASLFAAMRRRETYGTSGPRMRVRLFAGYGLEGVNLASDAGVRHAYTHGVPMGGELAARAGQSPDFVFIALRDANSAALQRVQIVKGWTDARGQALEEVYDVTCADGGVVNSATRRCPDNGARVDLQTCAPSPDKGDAQLQGHWRDAHFDASQNAFYYVRVLENPSCRWSTWDAIRAGAEPNPRLPATVQERAYSSPIWIMPAHAS
jgi:hypothetical protein